MKFIGIVISFGDLHSRKNPLKYHFPMNSIIPNKFANMFSLNIVEHLPLDIWTFEKDSLKMIIAHIWNVIFNSM